MLFWNLSFSESLSVAVCFRSLKICALQREFFFEMSETYAEYNYFCTVFDTLLWLVFLFLISLQSQILRLMLVKSFRLFLCEGKSPIFLYGPKEPFFEVCGGFSLAMILAQDEEGGEPIGYFSNMALSSVCPDPGTTLARRHPYFFAIE